jgi:LysM repeat protein
MKYFTLCLFISVSTLAFGQRYILFNPVCMERLQYDIAGGEEYVVYALRLSNTERILLEVGKENENPESRIARAVITCNNPSISRDIVDRMKQSNREEYFIARKESKGQYIISPVISASYLRITEQGLEYEAKDYRFMYSKSSDARQNLADPATGARAFYVGTTGYDCLNAYSFNVTTRANENKDITILPQIGLVQSRDFANGGAVATTARRLARVNTNSLVEHIKQVCQNGGVVENVEVASDARPPRPTDNYYEGAPDSRDRFPDRSSTTTNSDYGVISRYTGSYNNNSPDTYNTKNDERVNTPTTANNNTNSSTLRKTHTVKSKETLFSIAKQYGVTVDDLKRWNNLKTNLIIPGNRLIVTNSGVAETNAVRVENSQPKPTVAVEQRWRTTDGFHRVRRGESIAQIAAMYGFTEDKFRYINGLTPTENIYEGYELKTRECECPSNQNNRYVVNEPRSTFRFEDEGDLFPKGANTSVNNFSPSVTTPAPYGYSAPMNISYDQQQPSKIHIVRENDNLYSIAKRYNTTVERLRIVNNLDPKEVLLPDQKLIIR